MELTRLPAPNRKRRNQISQQTSQQALLLCPSYNEGRWINVKDKLKIPQNSAGYVKALNMDKKNANPVKKTGKDLRSGK